MIRASDRVAAVLAKDERLIEVFVKASPAFDKLRNPALRKTMARLVTVEQAARIAGVDADVLVAHLNQGLEGMEPLSNAAPSPLPSVPVGPQEPIPPALLAIPAERIVDVDVREDLRAGREPFRRILDAARALPPGNVLRVRAIFEPVPLYAVLGKQALTHFTERLAADDWRVWFHRDSSIERTQTTRQPSAPEPHAKQPDPDPPNPKLKPEVASEEDVLLIDVRGLEPPEPMVRTLEALAVMPRGKTLVQINVRVPQFLLPKLKERGFTYEIREQSEDIVRLFIRHADQ